MKYLLLLILLLILLTACQDNYIPIKKTITNNISLDLTNISTTGNNTGNHLCVDNNNTLCICGNCS